jgi:hypothetical protein
VAMLWNFQPAPILDFSSKYSRDSNVYNIHINMFLLSHRLPDKLQLVKPLEGSSTLRHWQHLATPNFASALFESQRPGVQHRYVHLDGGYGDMNDSTLLRCPPSSSTLLPEGSANDQDDTGSSSVELDEGKTRRCLDIECANEKCSLY